ncbi:MAG TPA: hypothetical protein VGP82_19450 [Ktedonobacterales bacterium]|nr:hypothetical protein [Ktedonobacterales bacterium]
MVEQIEVEAPRPLVDFVLKQAGHAHEEMLANLKALHETDALVVRLER